MHRQAMLVSLSLSPSSTAAKNDKHWAFLAEIDAPQWVDLKAEEAQAGKIGDDPWFYQSHSHHEIPLNGGQSANRRDAKSNVRDPQIERKKAASSKTRLAFHPSSDGQILTNSNTAGFEDYIDSSLKASFLSESDDVANNLKKDEISSPILCKSPERFMSSRRLTSQLPTDDFLIQGNGVRRDPSVPNSREDVHKIRHVETLINVDACIRLSSTSTSQDFTSVIGGEARPGPTGVSWHETNLPRLNDMRRLRKSLGSALRVKIDDTSEPTGAGCQEAGTSLLLKDKQVRQSIQWEPSKTAEASGFDTGTSSHIRDNGESQESSEADRIETESIHSGAGLASRLGTNSSVHAFDDIRRMRKSWGSALRVKIREELEPVVAENGPKHKVPELTLIAVDTKAAKIRPICSLPEKAELDSSPILLETTLLDSPGTSGGHEDIQNTLETVSSLTLEKVVQKTKVCAFEWQPMHRTKEVRIEKDLQLFPTTKIAVGSSVKYRRSMSFGYGQEKVTDNAFLTTQSNSIQQKQGLRAPPSAQSHSLIDRSSKVQRPSKGGKENAAVQSLPKLKPSIGPSVATAKKGRQSVLRMSMPSMTFAAHARQAAQGMNGGSTLNQHTNMATVPSAASKSGSCKGGISSARKSMGALDTGPRKRTAVPVTAVPHDTTSRPAGLSRQSSLRSSMSVLTPSTLRQTSKLVQVTGISPAHGEKRASKFGGDADEIAALIAEHNRKFRPKPKYEPRIHSVKDIREWETRTGQQFYNLQPAERERVNQEISAAKQVRH